MTDDRELSLRLPPGKTIRDLRRVRIMPGEVLWVRCSFEPEPDEVRSIEDDIARTLPHVPVWVTGPDVDLTVIAAEPEGADIMRAGQIVSHLEGPSRNGRCRPEEGVHYHGEGDRCDCGEEPTNVHAPL